MQQICERVFRRVPEGQDKFLGFLYEDLSIMCSGESFDDKLMLPMSLRQIGEFDEAHALRASRPAQHSFELRRGRRLAAHQQVLDQAFRHIHQVYERKISQFHDSVGLTIQSCRLISSLHSLFHVAPDFV